MQTRGVLNLRYSFLPTTLSEKHTSRRGMRENMSTYGFTAVGSSKKSTRTRITLHLVGLTGA